MSYRAILLDFYGTIVHEDDRIIADICRDILAESKTALSERDIASRWWASFCQHTGSARGDSFLPQRQIAHESLTDTIRHFGIDINPTPLVERQFAHWVEPGVFPDSHDFLQFLQQIGMPVCIVSNIDRADLEKAIDFHGFNFKHVITSDDVRAYKPHPEMFTAALANLNLAPTDVLHIGDSRTSDVAGALSLGIPVAWVNRDGKKPQPSSRPTFTVQNLEELMSILT